MLLANALAEYRNNFKTALVFGLLLVFAPIAFFLGNVFIGSGTVFLDYNLALVNPLLLLPALAFGIVYLLFYSFFVSIIIFSVRKDLSTLRFHYYLRDMIHKFAWKVFVFYLILFLVLFFIGTILFFFNAPAALAAVILLVISSALLFVPQAIVVDEERISSSVQRNFEFIAQNLGSFAYVFLTAMILLGILQAVELAFDFFSMIGGYVSLVISLVFIVPFIEILKTYVYLLKYDLVKTPELLHRTLKKKQGTAWSRA